MRILSFDQAMGTTGYALCDGVELVDVGQFSTSYRETGLNAMMIQRDHMVEKSHDLEADIVFVEGVHYRRNVKTGMLLAGLLYMTIAALTDNGIPYLVVESSDIVRHLHLRVAKTNRQSKGERSIAYARNILYGNPANGPKKDPPIDICSAIVILDTGLMMIEQPPLVTLTSQVLVW